MHFKYNFIAHGRISNELKLITIKKYSNQRRVYVVIIIIKLPLLQQEKKEYINARGVGSFNTFDHQSKVLKQNL